MTTADTSSEETFPSARVARTLTLCKPGASDRRCVTNPPEATGRAKTLRRRLMKILTAPTPRPELVGAHAHAKLIISGVSRVSGWDGFIRWGVRLIGGMEILIGYGAAAVQRRDSRSAVREAWTTNF